MGQKTALVITAGLTLFVLGTGGALAMKLTPQPPEVPVVETAVMATPDTLLLDTLLERDALYQERLVEANQIIQQANTTNAALQSERDTLVEQNNALLEREALYRQEIEKANALLQQQAAESSVIVAAAPSQATAPVQASAPPQPQPPVAMPAQADDDHDDDDDHDHDDDSYEDAHDGEDHEEEHEEHEEHEERDDD
jgi:hypothetical protein